MKKFIIGSLIVSSILFSGVQAFAATNQNIQENQTTSGREKRDYTKILSWWCRTYVITNNARIKSTSYS